MSSAAKAVRKRLKEEFQFYALHALKIRTKAGQILPLRFNTVQKKLQKLVDRQMQIDGQVRILILKARQQGLSTWTSGYLYFCLSQEKAQKGIVVAHKSDSTRSLFDMYKRFHSECPEPLKPSTSYSGRKELVFDRLDSAIQVATAGGTGIARGETLQAAHLSEVAFWPQESARDNFTALTQAIPNTPGSIVIIESTANGMSGNLFYELWQGAGDVVGQPGTNGYVRFFSPWFDSEEYREPVHADFERNLDEQDLVDLYGLDNEQLQFRRTKVLQNGKAAFEVEYPSNADEAFKSSGRPVFNPDQILEMLRKAPEPITRMAVEDGNVFEHPRGELLVYHPHDKSEVYTIGADVAMGARDGDYSVAQVFDSKRRQVAVWRGQVDPDYYATILNTLGLHYNTALIAPEANNHGILTCVRLGRDKHYPRIYTDVSEGKLADQHSINIGFKTTQKTKPLIIDRLRASLRENQIEINDKTTLREMLSYIVTESGGMEAENGCFDDCVMSLAIANHCHEGKFEPVDMPDDLYVEAI